MDQPLGGRRLLFEEPVAGDPELDRAAQLLDVAQRDVARRVATGLFDAQTGPAAAQRPAEPPAVPRHQCGRPREQPGDPQPTGGVLGELDVVDLAHGQAVAVDDLAVEQVEHRVEGAVEPVHHAPIPVTIISGSAASAATAITTR